MQNKLNRMQSKVKKKSEIFILQYICNQIYFIHKLINYCTLNFLKRGEGEISRIPFSIVKC